MVIDKSYKLFSMDNSIVKKMLVWLINLLILSVIPTQKYIYSTEQSWQMIIFACLASILGGILVSYIVFGGQLSNKYCPAKTLDRICKWSIFILYFVLLFLIFLYYLPVAIGTLTKPNLGGVIFLFTFNGMLIGLFGVKTKNEKRGSSV